MDITRNPAWTLYVLDLEPLDIPERYTEPRKTMPQALKAKAYLQQPTTRQVKANVPKGYHFQWHDYRKTARIVYVGVVKNHPNPYK
jgi:hypothetical protein